MKRKLRMAALTMLALGLAACNETAPEQKTGEAVPTPPAPPPQASARKPEPAVQDSPQARLSADMELSSKVKSALREPARSHVEVAASDGVVTLYGTVEQPADKDRVALVAMGVEGVRSVVNNLVVLAGS